MSTWEVLYRGDRYAFDEDWDVEEPGVSGLYSVTQRIHDLERSHGDGDVKGPATVAPVQITIPLYIRDNVAPEAVADLCDALVVTWALIRDGSLEELTITRADSTYVMLGAPASGFNIRDNPKSGSAAALCLFTVHDARITRVGS